MSSQVSSWLPLLFHTPDNFRGGKIFYAKHLWGSLSQDSWVYNVVRGKFIEFVSIPFQAMPPRPLTLSHTDTQALDDALCWFLTHSIVEPCIPGAQGFFSNVFPIMKPTGPARIILNLKDLNIHVPYLHFKMDTLKDVLLLIFPNCFFVTVDFKDAYFSIYVQPEDRKWLQFLWKGRPFRFTCLPQGLSSAPRTFTKLMKPVLSHLRSLGIVVSCYLDDCLFIAPSPDLLRAQVSYALQLFDSLGLTINVQKSVLEPTQSVTFLGVVLNSLTMTVTLSSSRKERIKRQGLLLLNGDTSLLDLSSFIGLAVAAGPAVELAPLRYRYLEILRNKGLSQSCGNYLSHISLDTHARTLVTWWVTNVDSQVRSIHPSLPDCELFTDASLTGWGASMGAVQTGGHWAQVELDHINSLELKSILLGLQSLCKDRAGSHVRLRSDNATAVACINRCGSMRPTLQALTEQIFEWAASRGISLSAAHVQGVSNVTADKESRISKMDSEWMLQPCIFRKLCQRFYTPEIDLFATRLNAQVSTYISWKPDPSALDIDAFTLDWGGKSLYAFPPFSVISRALRKLQDDGATVLMILPLWPTQVWFPMALQLLVDAPVLLPRCPLVLPQQPTLTHPRAHKMVLTAMLLSGRPSHVEEFHQKLPIFAFTRGDLALRHNIGRISTNGCYFVSGGRLIPFTPL